MPDLDVGTISIADVVFVMKDGLPVLLLEGGEIRNEDTSAIIMIWYDHDAIIDNTWRVLARNDRRAKMLLFHYYRTPCPQPQIPDHRPSFCVGCCLVVLDDGLGCG